MHRFINITFISHSMSFEKTVNREKKNINWKSTYSNHIDPLEKTKRHEGILVTTFLAFNEMPKSNLIVSVRPWTTLIIIDGFLVNIARHSKPSQRMSLWLGKSGNKCIYCTRSVVQELNRISFLSTVWIWFLHVRAPCCIRHHILHEPTLPDSLPWR